MSQLRRLRSIVGGSAGNLVKWYDWYAYAAFALYFADDFFPKGDQTAQLLNTAAIFAVGSMLTQVTLSLSSLCILANAGHAWRWLSPGGAPIVLP